jgi:hypothetical protein
MAQIIRSWNYELFSSQKLMSEKTAPKSQNRSILNWHRLALTSRPRTFFSSRILLSKQTFATIFGQLTLHKFLHKFFSRIRKQQRNIRVPTYRRRVTTFRTSQNCRGHPHWQSPQGFKGQFLRGGAWGLGRNFEPKLNLPTIGARISQRRVF